ncbi:Protein piccolo [Bagarius yarrelli]|uniref:Protein piccolo n=1 Tax=Bagarius yarrelli TaxID=175774 RepID=A0A556UFN0_BAGYA|nr:Protein piccolo [Bagarius yarrelli]
MTARVRCDPSGFSVDRFTTCQLGNTCLPINQLPWVISSTAVLNLNWISEQVDRQTADEQACDVCLEEGISQTLAEGARMEEPSLSDKPETAYLEPAKPQPQFKIADKPQTAQFKPVKPQPQFKMADKPQTAHLEPVKPQPQFKMADKPQTAHLEPVKPQPQFKIANKPETAHLKPAKTQA